MRTLSQAVFPAMPTPPTTPARLSDLSELQRCLLAGALLTMGLSLVALPAGAQTAGSPAPAADATAAPEATTSVDDILASEEDVLAGTTYSYDPGSRRDPFRSLLAAQNKAERKGALPEGIPGLLIEEIDLTGIFRTSRGFVAQVLASNK